MTSPRGPTEYERLLREERELRERLSGCESDLGAMTCSRDEYRAACNAVARERDNAIHELALAEDEVRTLRAEPINSGLEGNQPERTSRASSLERASRDMLADMHDEIDPGDCAP